MLRPWIVKPILLALLALVVGLTGCEKKAANVNEEEKKKIDDAMEKTKTPSPTRNR